MFEEIDDAGAVGKTEHGAHGIHLDATAAMGDRLVEQRQAVTGGALGGTGDHGERIRLEFHAFLAQEWW
jgi:hypothetical protein